MSAPRRQIVELAYHLASNGGDPLSAASKAVTEGRIEGYLKGRSTSCGDLLHCVAFACGNRSNAINRTEHEGWTPGVNLSRWFVPSPSKPHHPHGGVRHFRPRLEQIKPGDFVCYDYLKNGGKSAHGLIVLAIDYKTGDVCTADYGQPGGRIYYVKASQGRPMIWRGRSVDCVVDVDTIDWTEAPLNVFEFCVRHGITVDPVVPFEYIGPIR